MKYFATFGVGAPGEFRDDDWTEEFSSEEARAEAITEAYADGWKCFGMWEK